MKRFFLYTAILVSISLITFSYPAEAAPLLDLPAEVRNSLSEDLLLAIDRPYAIVNGSYTLLDGGSGKVKPYLYKFDSHMGYMLPLKAVASYAGADYRETGDEIIIDNIHLKISGNKVTGVSGTAFIYEDDYKYMQFKDGSFYIEKGMLGKLFTTDGFSYNYEITDSNSTSSLIHISRADRAASSSHLQYSGEPFEYMLSLPAKLKFSNAIVIQQSGPYARAFDKDARFDSGNLAVKPITRKNRMLVPVKFFGENYGAQIKWEAKSRTATVTLADKQISITAGKAYMLVNGKNTALEVPAELYEGRMYIPLKAVSQVFRQNLFYTSGIAVLSPAVISPGYLTPEEVSIFNRYFKARKENDLDEANKNSPNNSSNVKHVVKQGQWTYYIDYGYNSKYNFNGLWRINDDGKTRQKLVNGRVDYIDVVGDWVYFFNDKGSYKIKTDGTSFTRIYMQDYKIQKQHIRDGLIYYFDWRDNSFFSHALDGLAAGSRISLNTQAYLENMIGDYIYYTNRSNGDTLYRLNITTGVNTKISNEGVSGFAVMDDYIYYTRGDNVPGIYRLPLNAEGILTSGSASGDLSPQKLSGAKADSINAGNGWIYYSDRDNGGKLCKIRADGTGTTRLNDQPSGNLNLVGDWVYYRSDGKLFRIKTNGTGKSRLNPDTLGLDPKVIGPPISVPPVGKNAITLEQTGNTLCKISKPVEDSRKPDISISLEHNQAQREIRFTTYNMRDPKVSIKVAFIFENGTRKEFILKNPNTDGIATNEYNYSKDVFTGETIRLEISWSAYGESGKASAAFKSVM